MVNDATVCAVCGIPSTLQCGGCGGVFYCGKEHQKRHWKQTHKALCKCYEITASPLLGRHLRATRDIRPGELILRESPLIHGPKVSCRPLCLGCHRTLPPPQPPQRNYYKCSQCGWPMCGPPCESASAHRDECALMTRRQFSVKLDYTPDHDVGKREAAYCVILPLRCLLLKIQHPEQYERFAQLQDHLVERMETPLYRVMHANLVTFIRTVLGLSEWSAEDVMRVAAILDTNAFELRQTISGVKVRAIYPNAAMISHDCVANARHTFDERMHIVFMAKTAIRRGDIIATSYTQPLKSTLLRRVHLKQAKCFDCDCARCRDASEFGTFAGALLCADCKVGKIISVDPLDNAALWRCQLCSRTLSAAQMTSRNDTLQREIETLDKRSPAAFEAFLKRHEDLLPEGNTHALQVKYALTQLYGHALRQRRGELDDAQLARQMALCEELLTVADKFDPGWSIFRGNLLLDWYETLVAQADRATKKGENDSARYAKAQELLQEASAILRLEPEIQERLRYCAAALEGRLRTV